MTTSLLKRRTVILTGATAAITAVGAYTGALLKMDVETRTGVDERREEGLDTRIERLKNYRDRVERKKIEMEAKILGLYEKKDHRS
ncbi:hypothetical protein Q9L58_004236 [Maublancomyces gigas]|uniref:Uncharacterized protein n=1 Tax=Discina gigas TaxID=1032678 RepID=A0ABR3GLG1_9PEZI